MVEDGNLADFGFDVEGFNLSFIFDTPKRDDFGKHFNFEVTLSYRRNLRVRDRICLQ